MKWDIDICMKCDIDICISIAHSGGVYMMVFTFCRTGRPACLLYRTVTGSVNPDIYDLHVSTLYPTAYICLVHV